MDTLPWQRALDTDLEHEAGRALPASSWAHAFVSQILDWYTSFGREFPWRDPNVSLYEVVVAEVLLQRTRAETVARFLPIFLATYPNWSSLSSAPVSQIESVLRPIGIQTRRARTLKDLACAIMNNEGALPTDPIALFSLPGVGQYVFNAINLYRNKSPLPLLDAGMARVLERHFESRDMADIRYDPYLQQLSHFVISLGDPKLLNWAILDLAATVCRNRSPHCGQCPVAQTCEYFADLISRGEL